MDVRPYLPTDRAACLAVFDSNVPQYFAANERDAFSNFLDNPDGAYLVMEHGGAIVGCGGYAITSGNKLARLLWGIIHHDAQRQGLGRFLLLYRIREIGKMGDVELVTLDASPNVASFYEKQGFKPYPAVKSGLVGMAMKLKVCS